MVADHLGQQFGNYRLVSLLGQGGYAEVYLGQHVRLDLQAAIKVLHTHLTGDEAEHFQQEAQTIARLAHPSIVRVFDFDVQEGVPFLVMDYAPNGSLRLRYPKGKLVPLPHIVSSVKLVAAALQYAHDKKFIHRDVKPENMLIGQHQEVLLSDFGIATIAHSTSSLSARAQGTSGTLAYMAPEQIEGHPRPASDQYALAVVIYEWLCGERPFEGSASEVMAQHLSMPPPPLRERVLAIPPEIEQVVLRALAKDPKARFASVAAFSAALEQASQRALAPTAQLASEQPAPSPAAATSYDTEAVAPSQPVLPTETTPSADLPGEALDPTMYYDPHPPCPVFDLAAANKLLADNGWVKSADGVRAKVGQRLEFEYSSAVIYYNPWRTDAEVIIQRNFRAIGIQLDIQYYPIDTFFGSFLTESKASPPTGAVAGRYDIAEFYTSWFYDPDDSPSFACNQIPPKGFNVNFYCNHALDTPYKQEQATVDPGLRQKIFYNIHRIYLTEFPYIALFSPPELSIVHKGTHNYQPSPFTGETVNIWEWWCDKGKC